MNIAELGIKVESASAEQAGDALDALVQSGARAEQAAGKVGAAWDAAGKKVSKSADGATASIEEQREELSKLIGQIDPTVAALDRLDAQQKKLQGFKSAGLIDSETFERFNSRLEQTRTGLSAFDDNLNRTGNTAKQTAAALRGVPAQFTDIVVSLQAGQAPLTVLLQQGGQLKDMFGGIGPAARALGGYVAGLVNPFTAAAAAVGVLGLAYYQGSEESERYAKALILTGNAAGTSANQLAGIAEKISAVSGTTGQAAEALTLLASTGKVSADNLEAIGSAAVSFSSATGVAISDVVQQYAELGKAPVEASRKLNEQYGYLTTAVYQQITALVEQGNTQEAAAVAQRAYADAQQQMTIKVKANLGALETAWAALGSGAKRAWDAMLGIGREETLEDRIKDLESKIKKRAELGGYDNTVLERQLTGLRAQLSTQQQQAKAEGELTQRRKDGASAIDYLNARAETGLDKQAKKERELEKAQKARFDALADGADPAAVEKKYQLALKGIEESFKETEKKTRKVAAPALDTTSVNTLQNDLKLVVGEYDAAEKKIEALSRAGLISQTDAYQQRVTLLGQEKAKVQEAYGAQISAIEQLQGRSNLSAQQRISLENQVADARAAQTKALTDLDAKREQLTINEQGRQAKLQQATDSYNRSLDAQVELLRLQGERAAAAVGMGREQAALYNELNRANDEYVKGLRDLDKLLAEGSINQEQYNQRLSALQRQQTQLQEQVIDNYRLMQVAQSDWSNGANAAWQDYLSNARDVAGQTRDAFTDALTGMEDYLLSFITGTKASFKDLVRSIIADFARIQLKQIISGIGGSSGSTGFLASVGQAFGFGGGSTGSGGSGSGVSSALSLADTGLKAYNFLSGTGANLYNAYQSGGLSGLYDYGANSIAGYFGSNAATAAGTTLTTAGANAAIGLGSTATGAAANAATGVTVQGLSSAVNTGADAVAAGLGYGAGSGASATAAGSAASSAGLSALGAAGYGIGGAIAGYQAAGLKGAATGAGGAVAGAYAGAAIGSVVPIIGTAIGAAIGAMLGGMLGSSVWGGDWQTKDAGLALGVTNGDFDGASFEYQKKKGGLFGKNKKRTIYTALDDATQSALAETYAATEDSVENLYKKLGVQLNDGVLDGLTIGRTQISTKGKTDEEIQKELTAWFGTVADSMTSAINDATNAGLTGFNFETLTKFVNNLYSVNDAIRYLNVGLYDTSVAGGKLAEALAMTAGGLDALQKNTATYFDQFFTDTEKANATLDSVTRAFKDADVALPETREGFRKAVEALDLTTDAGQEMFATLTSMAGQADAYYDILEQRTQSLAQALAEAQSSMLSAALGTLQRAVKKQQDAIQEAYNARTEALNASLSSSQSAVSSLTSMTNSLSSALKTMLGQSDQATRVLYGQATATLETAAAIARAGGSLANFQGLDDALSTVTGNNSSGYGDWLSFARDQGRSAALIGELSATAGDQLTSAEKTVKGIQDQLDLSKKQFDLESKMLQGQLDLAQAQIDAINGVDNTLLSIAEALAQFGVAIKTASPNGTGSMNADSLIEAAYQAALGRGADKAGADYWKQQLASGAVSSNNLQNAISQAGAANGESINTAFANILGRAPDAASLAYWQQQVANGNVTDINAAIRAAAMQNGQIPAYAAGGDHFGGFRVVGEFGREIEATGPAKYYSASKTAEMLNGGGNSAALLTEMRAVRAELTEMKYSNSSIAKHTRKTADGLAQINETGIRTQETA